MRMNSLILSLTVVGALAMPLLYAAPAQAQRTWVSGVGDDANPCSRTAPCKTWAGAISKTAPGGEIDALDPGGFGAVTITKSMTIDGGGGQVASIVVAGTNAIVVAAGATDVVIIKNVRFQGLLGAGNANAGTNAIRFITGLKLVVENCEIYGFGTNGIDIANTTAGNVTAITNTQIMNIGSGAAIFVESAGTSQVDVSEVRIYDAKFGVSTAANNTVVVSRSIISNMSTQAVHADANGTVALNNNVISFSALGVGGGGNLKSFNNNAFFGNTTNGTTSPIGSTSNPSGLQ